MTTLTCAIKNLNIILSTISMDSLIIFLYGDKRTTVTLILHIKKPLTAYVLVGKQVNIFNK